MKLGALTARAHSRPAICMKISVFTEIITSLRTLLGTLYFRVPRSSIFLVVPCSSPLAFEPLFASPVDAHVPSVPGARPLYSAVVADGPIDDLPGYSSEAAESQDEFLDMGELDDMEVDPSSFGPSRPYVNQQVSARANTAKWHYVFLSRHFNEPPELACQCLRLARLIFGGCCCGSTHNRQRTHVVLTEPPLNSHMRGAAPKSLPRVKHDNALYVIVITSAPSFSFRGTPFSCNRHLLRQRRNGVGTRLTWGHLSTKLRSRTNASST